MRKYYRTIVFTKTPLKSQFRYKNKFQILPIESKVAPACHYSKHFPLFLEYYIDSDKNKTSQEINVFDNMAARYAVEYEIINILSVLSNHHFFKYRPGVGKWVMKAPNADLIEMSKEQRAEFNNQNSTWCIDGYTYPGIYDELEIEKFTVFKFPITPLNSDYFKYFTHDPVENDKGEILFPATITSCLDNFYFLSTKTQKKIKSSVSLICDGIDISDYKRSLAFLSFVSAIEVLVGLEFSDKEIKFDCDSCKSLTSSPYKCLACGKPIWGIKAKYKEFLRKFVAGSEKSLSTYNKIYNLRCKIAHQGQLFIGDIELSLDNMEKKGSENLINLKSLQLARLSLTNWLRYEEKASR